MASRRVLIAGLPLGYIMLAVFVFALNLRGAPGAIGPLLAEITEGLGMSALQVGVLTALPPIIFGLAGFVAVRLASRAGLSGTLVIAAVILTVGLGLRPWILDPWAFIGLSVIGLIGIALANVLMPAWIKTHGRLHTVKLMTTYSAVLVASGTVASVTAAPLAAAFQREGETLVNWQAALFSWAIPAVLAVVLWLRIQRHTGNDFAVSPTESVEAAGAVDTPQYKPIWHSPRAWALTGLFGLQSLSAYVQFGWLPQIYRDAGASATTAGAMLAFVTAFGIVGGLVFPTVVDRVKDLRWIILGLGASAVLGYLGLSVAPVKYALLWALLLGIGGTVFSLAIAMITARSRDPQVTAKLSGFVQPAGYLLAGAGTMAVGVFYEYASGWGPALYFMAGSAVLMVVCGWFVGRPGMVDDELIIAD